MNTLYNTDLDILPIGSVITGKWNKIKYTIIKTLGSGENGNVYLVKSNNNNYALKMSQDTINLSNEIRIAQRLNKTQGSNLGFSIFDIDDFAISGKNYTFYIMPYYKGLNIEQYLFGKSEKEYLLLFKKIINILVLIHKQGMIYGDLKPEHIVIDPVNKKIALIDFGGITKLGQGIRQYTEIYDRGSWRAGDRKADPHYDFFSLAMIFVQTGLGKNKLVKIFKHSGRFNGIYDIIPKVNVLKPLSPIIKNIFRSHLTDPNEIINQIDKQLENLIQQKKANKWIDWAFILTLLLFIIMVILFFRL